MHSKELGGVGRARYRIPGLVAPSESKQGSSMFHGMTCVLVHTGDDAKAVENMSCLLQDFTFPMLEYLRRV